MSGIMEGPPRYPFEILPKEMWEMIILEVKDSEDLRNLMKASKQLNDSFGKMRHLWLLDKILPILTTSSCNPYLEGEDVMKLRLVDKRWCGAVNTFLENQPNLRPYNKDDDKLNSEAHIWCHRDYRDSSKTRGIVFRTNEGVAHNFGNMFETLPEFGNAKGNPFPSRYVTRFALHDRRRPDTINFWGEVGQDVSQRLGEHVWFLDMIWPCAKHRQCIEFGLKCYQGSVWKWILHSLMSLPNLKSLRLKFREEYEAPNSEMMDSELKEFLQSEDQLPTIPCLESLKIPTLPTLLSQQLMSKYFLQLRRLNISVSAWSSCDKWVMPNLTELKLCRIETSANVSHILVSLEAPQLTKLHLETDLDIFVPLKMEEDIFPWITLFPSLLCLDVAVGLFSISESGALEPRHDSKPSLKYLKIHNSFGVNYNFLRCLPNLQRLQINTDEEPIVWDCSVYPEVKIKLELETNSLYESNVWEICPKLKTISVYCCLEAIHQGIIYKEFDRTTYEKIKNGPEQQPPKNVKLRQDIFYFLELLSDSDQDSDSEDDEEAEEDTDQEDDDGAEDLEEDAKEMERD